MPRITDAAYGEARRGGYAHTSRLRADKGEVVEAWVAHLPSIWFEIGPGGVKAQSSPGTISEHPEHPEHPRLAGEQI